MARVVIVVGPNADELGYQVELWGHLVSGVVHGRAELSQLPHNVEVMLIDGGGELFDRDLIEHCRERQLRAVAVVETPEQHLRAVGLGCEVIDRAELSTLLPELLAGAMLAPVQRDPAGGRVVAVWGAKGSPGTSTLVVNLAAEWAEPAKSRRAQAAAPRICLIDLDCWAPALAPILGRVSEIPGVAAAARLAERGELTEAELGRLSVPGPGESWLLGGLTALDRWPELSAERVSALIASVRDWFDLVLIDVGSHSSVDEATAADPLAPHRTAAAHAAVASASLVIGVGAADPIGLARLVRAWPEWQTQAERALVINRLRARVLGAQPTAQVRRACEQFLGVEPIAILPDDAAAADAALCAAEPLNRAAPRSSLRVAIAELAKDLSMDLGADSKPMLEAQQLAPLR